MAYRVAKGRTLMIGSNTGFSSRTLREGTVLDEAILASMGKGEIDRQIEAGFIVNDGQSYQHEERPLGGTVPGATSSREGARDITDPSATSFSTSNSKSGDTGTSIRTGSKPSGTKEPAVKQRESIWDLNPANLKDKSLDELRVMIQERDSSLTKEDLEALSTVEDAINFLSSDYKPEN